MKLALFDLDNTLLAGDSDHAWGDFLVEKGLVDKDVHQKTNNAFYHDYLNGCLDIYAYLEFSLAFLSQHPLAELNTLHAEFMAQKIAPLYLPKANALIAKHKAAGDCCVIITATNDFVTAPIAQQLGIDHLIATQAERTVQGYTGKVKGEPCYQEGKITRLEAWLTFNNKYFTDSIFYSDSQTDIPLMEWANTAVAVNPNDKLKAHAEQQHWQILDLR